MATAPKSVTIRAYHVGFGDCFLLSFQYTQGERHVLIDYGSTGLPADVPKTRMMDIALDIERRTGGKLHAVVATHRHKDHISGFETKKNGKGTGDVIARLKPDIVVQPWTEDPKLATKATGPKLRQLRSTAGRQVAALALMHAVAEQTLKEAKRTRHFAEACKNQLSFLGETNLANLSAVKNLMHMATNAYVYYGKKSGLEKVLPGVTIEVLGPPTVEQTDTIKTQRSQDADEFWHLQANAMRFAQPGNGATPALFPRYVRSRGKTFPINARWLVYRARSMRGESLLQIVRMLDKAMNNTSVILVFEVGNKRLLFPGDAQIENWEYALSKDKNKTLLSRVNLYKVGHHGSLNATPKTLWNLFKHRSANRADAKRLLSLMSTMKHKHGHEEKNTEVPRRTLVNALKSDSEFFTTQELEGKGKPFYHDTVMKF